MLFIKIFFEEKDYQAIEKYSSAIKNLSVFNDLFEQFVSISKANLFYFVCRLDYYSSGFTQSEIKRSIALFNAFYTKDEIEMVAKQMKSGGTGQIYRSLTSK